VLYASTTSGTAPSQEQEPELLDAFGSLSVAASPAKVLVQPDIETTAQASQVALRLAANVIQISRIASSNLLTRETAKRTLVLYLYSWPETCSDLKLLSVTRKKKVALC
jgi:hypothetical protein